MKIYLEIDNYNQWFVPVWVAIGGRIKRVEFKVDTGCNSLVLSHSTLEIMGFSVSKAGLSKLPPAYGKLASGDKHTLRKLGAVTLYQDKGQTVQICKADAICHTTQETNDLLGTEVLRQFTGVSFGLVDDRFMELK
jgi:hypothetical protein